MTARSWSLLTILTSSSHRRQIAYFRLSIALCGVAVRSLHFIKRDRKQVDACALPHARVVHFIAISALQKEMTHAVWWRPFSLPISRNERPITIDLPIWSPIRIAVLLIKTNMSNLLADVYTRYYFLYDNLTVSLSPKICHIKTRVSPHQCSLRGKGSIN